MEVSVFQLVREWNEQVALCSGHGVVKNCTATTIRDRPYKDGGGL